MMMMICELNFHIPSDSPQTLMYFDFKRFPLNSFTRDYVLVGWNEVKYLDSMDEKNNFVIEVMLELFDIYALLKTVTFRWTYKHYITDSTKMLLSESSEFAVL